jgi:hypothetical protein
MKGNPLSQKLVPRMLARPGVITRSPLFWVLATAVMAVAGGSRGRRAALRGSMCYLLGGGIGNLPKPLFGRAQPRHRRPRKPQVVRGAFPPVTLRRRWVTYLARHWRPPSLSCR